LLDVNEGEDDPLDEAGSRCFDAAVSGMSVLDARATIREELRRAFEAGRRHPIAPMTPQWDVAGHGGHVRPVDMPAPLTRSLSHAKDESIEHLASLLEQRAAVDIETARRIRELA
jgi:hypothetical protein